MVGGVAGTSPIRTVGVGTRSSEGNRRAMRNFILRPNSIRIGSPPHGGGSNGLRMKVAASSTERSGGSVGS
ncbi:MAG: hypothetical protein RLZZ93_529 [Actinomycetota bacterium]